MIKIVTALVLAVAAVAPAEAQDRGTRQTREFVEAAGQADQFEILEGQAALAQSSDPQVRDFARRMIKDHGETSRALEQAAQRSGLKPPSQGIGADQAALLGALQGMDGADFDKTYWRHQALAHRSALAVEQGYAASGDDPAVRQAAASAVPVIAGHLEMIARMILKSGGS